MVVGSSALLIVVGGLALVPLPGPGWVIVFIGLAIWASEFEWAQRLLDFARRAPADVERVAEAAGRWWVKGLVGLGTAALVVRGVLPAVPASAGSPGFMPGPGRGAGCVRLPGPGRLTRH